MSNTYTGGCDTNTRGQASLDRSAMESSKISDSSAYKAYSNVVHCPNGNTSNCPNTTNVASHLGKYSGK